jgi:hypothetical protein
MLIVGSRTHARTHSAAIASYAKLHDFRIVETQEDTAKNCGAPWQQIVPQAR